MKPKESSPQSAELFRHRLEEVSSRPAEFDRLVGFRARLSGAFSEQQGPSDQFRSVGGQRDLTHILCSIDLAFACLHKPEQ